MLKLLKSRFFKNASIYTISDILNKMVPFVLLPVLTRYLTPSDYGIISMFTVLSGILGVFISLETHTAIGVNYFKINKEQLKIYIANVLLIVTVATGIVLIIVLVFNAIITEIVKLPLEWLIIAIFVTLLTLFTTINIILWQSEERAIPVGIYRISQTLFNFGLTIILVVGYGMDWEGRLIASAAAALIFGFLSFTLFFKRDYIKFTINKTYLRSALKFGVPLVPHAIGVWVRTGIDRLLLTMLVSTTATGIYTVGFQIASVILVITIAFNKAYTPYLFKQLKNLSPEQKIKQVNYTYLYMILLLFLALILSVLSPFLIKTFIGEEFIDSQEYVTWFAFGFAFYGMNYLFANYIMYSERTIYLSYVTILLGIIHVILSYILILENGIIGAVQAFTIISFITFISVWALSQRVYPMPWLKGLR